MKSIERGNQMRQPLRTSPDQKNCHFKLHSICIAKESKSL